MKSESERESNFWNEYEYEYECWGNDVEGDGERDANDAECVWWTIGERDECEVWIFGGRRDALFGRK